MVVKSYGWWRRCKMEEEDVRNEIEIVNKLR